MPFYHLLTTVSLCLPLLPLLHISRNLFCHTHQTIYAPKSAQAYFTCVHICSPLSLVESALLPSLLALSTLHSCRLFRNHNALSSSDPNQTSLQLDTKQALQRRGERGKLPGNKTSKSTVCECKRSSRARRNSLCPTSWQQQHRGLMERKMRLCPGCCLLCLWSSCCCRVCNMFLFGLLCDLWRAILMTFSPTISGTIVECISLCVGVCGKLASHACVAYKWTHLSLVASCTLHWDKFGSVLLLISQTLEKSAQSWTAETFSFSFCYLHSCNSLYK